MNTERDRFLTEAMGECWHKTSNTEPYHSGCVVHICKCGQRELEDSRAFYNPGPNWVRQKYDDWQSFGKLWEWAQKQEWWSSFVAKKTPSNMRPMCGFGQPQLDLYIHPDRFADAIYTFLKEREAHK